MKTAPVPSKIALGLGKILQSRSNFYKRKKKEILLKACYPPPPPPLFQPKKKMNFLHH